MFTSTPPQAISNPTSQEERPEEQLDRREADNAAFFKTMQFETFDVFDELQIREPGMDWCIFTGGDFCERDAQFDFIEGEMGIRVRRKEDVDGFGWIGAIVFDPVNRRISGVNVQKAWDMSETQVTLLSRALIYLALKEMNAERPPAVTANIEVGQDGAYMENEDLIWFGFVFATLKSGKQTLWGEISKEATTRYLRRPHGPVQKIVGLSGVVLHRVV